LRSSSSTNNVAPAPRILGHEVPTLGGIHPYFLLANLLVIEPFDEAVQLQEQLRQELEEARLKYRENQNHETTAEYARALREFAAVVMDATKFPGT
jgi:hypothetical protein